MSAPPAFANVNPGVMTESPFPPFGTGSGTVHYGVTTYTGNGGAHNVVTVLGKIRFMSIVAANAQKTFAVIDTAQANYYDEFNNAQVSTTAFTATSVDIAVLSAELLASIGGGFTINANATGYTILYFYE